MEQVTLAVGEVAFNEQQPLATRHFCIEALAAGVPKYRSREQAADILAGWFPSDRLALVSLHRRIAENSLRAA